MQLCRAFEDLVHLKLSQGIQYEQMQGFKENAHSKALAPL